MHNRTIPALRRRLRQSLRRRARGSAARRARSQLGMTLIEIMVVVAIISLVVGGVSVAAFNQLKKASIDTAYNDVETVASNIELYMAQKRGKCPKTLEDLKAAGVTNKVPKDPWGNAYEFTCPGKELAVDVMSAGPDSEMGTADDIANYKDRDAEEAEEE